MKNLAARKGDAAALVMDMNAKLNAIMEVEFGKDDGREMPEVTGISWAFDRVHL